MKGKNGNKAIINQPQDFIQNKQIASASAEHFFCEIQAVFNINDFICRGKMRRLGQDTKQGIYEEAAGRTVGKKSRL